MCPYPSIDLAATGRNIARLRKAQGLTVRAIQAYFGFDDPQAIYRWQWGRSLPSVDNLYALSVLFGVSMNEILVPIQSIQHENEQQAEACCSAARGYIPLPSVLIVQGKRPAVIEPVVQNQVTISTRLPLPCLSLVTMS